MSCRSGPDEDQLLSTFQLRHSFDFLESVSMYRLLTAFAVLVLTMNTCQAQPNHIGVTEVEWNAKTGRFEVAMKLRATDLEDAISVITKKRWRLETAEDKERQIQSYLKQHFSITLNKHKACRLHWVGSELLLHDVWAVSYTHLTLPTIYSV